MKNVFLASHEAWESVSIASMHVHHDGGSVISQSSCHQQPNLRVVGNLHENKHWRRKLQMLKTYCSWWLQSTTNGRPFASGQDKTQGLVH